MKNRSVTTSTMEFEHYLYEIMLDYFWAPMPIFELFHFSQKKKKNVRGGAGRHYLHHTKFEKKLKKSARPEFWAFLDSPKLQKLIVLKPTQSRKNYP